ncbi:hypothetical protein DXG01_000814 [Tephrocybe rancida]|nr:hypothetical protein DXG01_000814 [Tephrocybe rancida]
MTAIDEPLLSPQHEDATTDDSEPMTPVKRTPLPKFQLFIIFLIQFAEPITATVIYPFINQFVRDTGVTRGDERKTGYYAGAIESTFFVAEALTVVYWGRASDWFGRRPVLLIGPLGLALSMLSFGLAKGYATLVVSRCMQGVFNGNIGGLGMHLTDSTNMADAFALIPLMWSLGTTIGPIIGGMLSQPAKTWPNVFGKFAFFHQYPYFLPCAVAAFVAFLPTVFTFVGLKETLPSAIVREKKKQAAAGQYATPDSTTSLLSGHSEQTYSATTNTTVEAAATEDDSEDQAPPPLRDLLVPRVLLTLVVYAFLAFSEMCTQVLQPLVYSTSVPLGGLGFEPYRIGVIMGTWGLINAVFQLTCLGWVLRRFGARKIQVFAHFSYCVVLALYPVLSFFARRAGGADGFVWVIIAVQLTFALSNSAAYASILMSLMDSAPSRSSLGTVNGLAQAIGSVTRGLAPTVASSLFSVSLEKKLAGGNLVFMILFMISAIGLRMTFLMPK